MSFIGEKVENTKAKARQAKDNAKKKLVGLCIGFTGLTALAGITVNTDWDKFYTNSVANVITGKTDFAKVAQWLEGYTLGKDNQASLATIFNKEKTSAKPFIEYDVQLAVSHNKAGAYDLAAKANKAMSGEAEFTVLSEEGGKYRVVGKTGSGDCALPLLNNFSCIKLRR